MGPNLLLENSRNSVLLNVPSLANFGVKDSARSFWIFRSKPAIEVAPPLPSPVEPCRGCPSRCLETGYGKPVKKPKKRRSCGSKEPLEIKEKPSNCVKETPVEEKLSWWEQIVGPDPKRSWPDPCTCRVAHRQKRKARAQDPRLSDARYKDTAGDVFLYTEQVKQCRMPCWEPQPKPPPAYKLPKALLSRMMSQDCEKGTLNQQTGEGCRHLLQKASYRIPYEELRPPERRQKPFSCREGIRPEDVLRPFSSDFTSCRIPATVQPLRSNNLSYQCPEETAKRASNVEKRSRIEQLKLLVHQKDTFHCISSSSHTT
ncbi:uncharacterized protein LOC143367991 [Andrena cerasifolii]|uniref:uncharacterized protein LOC143367991 n=1 Tax=Andrena cerasifolii TaxID=2819439 RepID=UPI004037ECBE